VFTTRGAEVLVGTGGSVGGGGIVVGGSVGGGSFVFVGSGGTGVPVGLTAVGEETGGEVTVVGIALVGVFDALGGSVFVGAGVFVAERGGLLCLSRVAVGGI
jgi:hypothetical protein